MFSSQGHGSTALGFNRKNEALGSVGWGWIFQCACFAGRAKPTPSWEPAGSGKTQSSVIPIGGAQQTLCSLGSSPMCPGGAASLLQPLWHLQCCAPNISVQATYFSFQKGHPNHL